MKISVIIPVYNEVNTVLKAIGRVESLPVEKEIVVVDDHSTDGTAEVVDNAYGNKIIFTKNEKNMGKGYSLRKGVKLSGGDIVMFLDADLEYYADEYLPMIRKIEEDKADIVFGSRFLGARRAFYFHHYLGNKALNLMANILYNTCLSDLMTGCKVFRGDLIRGFDLHANGFRIEAEITAQALKRKLRIYEIPASFNGRSYEEGKKIKWFDFFGAFYQLVISRFRVYDTGEDTLYRMRLMKNNNKWVFDKIKPFLGRAVLEIGSGIGNMSKFCVLQGRKLFMTEINDKYLELLKKRFGGNPNNKVMKFDAGSGDLPDTRGVNIDTVICINVLEHIKDDSKALSNFHDILEKGGRLILLVPALDVLFGVMDEKLGHFRRYKKKDLITKINDAGMELEDISYHNLISAFGWFFNGRILRKKNMSSFQVKMLDIFIPAIAFLERMIKIPFGLSIIAVCRKK